MHKWSQKSWTHDGGSTGWDLWFISPSPISPTLLHSIFIALSPWSRIRSNFLLHGLLFSGSFSESCPIPCNPMNWSMQCPSLSPGVCSNSRPLTQWCYVTISSSATPFSSQPQSFPAWGSFPVSWFFASGGQSIEASASVLPMNIQGWFPLRWTGLT